MYLLNVLCTLLVNVVFVVPNNVTVLLGYCSWPLTNWSTTLDVFWQWCSCSFCFSYLLANEGKCNDKSYHFSR